MKYGTRKCHPFNALERIAYFKTLPLQYICQHDTYYLIPPDLKYVGSPFVKTVWTRTRKCVPRFESDRGLRLLQHEWHRSSGVLSTSIGINQKEGLEKAILAGKILKLNI